MPKLGVEEVSELQDAVLAYREQLVGALDRFPSFGPTGAGADEGTGDALAEEEAVAETGPEAEDGAKAGVGGDASSEARAPGESGESAGWPDRAWRIIESRAAETLAWFLDWWRELASWRDDTPTKEPVEPSVDAGQTSHSALPVPRDTVAGLLKLSEALGEMRDGADAILSLLKAVNGHTDDFHRSVQDAVSSLDVPHGKLVSAAVGLDSKDLGDDLKARLEVLMDFLNAPSDAARRLRDRWSERLREALSDERVRVTKELVARLEGEWDNIASDVESSLEDFKASPVSAHLRSTYGGLDQQSKDAVRELYAGSPSVSVCRRFDDVASTVTQARKRLELLTPEIQNEGSAGHGGLSDAWRLPEDFVQSSWFGGVREHVVDARDILKKTALEVDRLACVWPDAAERDSFGYDKFLALDPIEQYVNVKCNAGTKLPFATACEG